MRNYFLMAFCGQYPANHFRNPLARCCAVDDDDDDDTDTNTDMKVDLKGEGEEWERTSARRQLRD